MSELGNRLREAREEKGLTLDDLEEMTKIQKRYLKGIEEGNYDLILANFMSAPSSNNMRKRSALMQI